MRIIYLEPEASTKDIEIIEANNIEYWYIDGTDELDIGHSVVMSATLSSGASVDLLLSVSDLRNLESTIINKPNLAKVKIG